MWIYIFIATHKLVLSVLQLHHISFSAKKSFFALDYVSVETHTICNKIQIFSKCVLTLSGYLNGTSMQYIK